MIEGLVTIALIVVLVARAVITLDHSEQAQRRARMLGVIAIPLLVGFVAVGVQRLLSPPLPTVTVPGTPSATPATSPRAITRWTASSAWNSPRGNRDSRDSEDFEHLFNVLRFPEQRTAE
jgi:hypothetical protein